MPEDAPTKYRPEYCQMLIEHMKSGLSYESFGGVCQVAKQTLYNWEKSFPEFLDAKNVGIELSRLWWEQMGRQGLFSEYQGSNINATIWVFNMKNRFGWRDKQPGEEQVTINNNLSSASDEEIDARITALEGRKNEPRRED